VANSYLSDLENVIAATEARPPFLTNIEQILADQPASRRADGKELPQWPFSRGLP
jgi:hypothetical protein